MQLCDPAPDLALSGLERRSVDLSFLTEGQSASLSSSPGPGREDRGGALASRLAPLLPLLCPIVCGGSALTPPRPPVQAAGESASLRAAAA